MAELTTQRLILRPVVRSDLPDILTLAGEAAVAETTAAIPHPLSEADVEEWLISTTPRDRRAYAVLRAEDQVFIGVLDLTIGGHSGPAHIAFWIGRPYWRQGYATEAVRRLLRFLFGERKLASVNAESFPENDAAIRVLGKVGFRALNRTMRDAPGRGGKRDVVIFAATRASFAQAALSQAVGRE